MTRILRPPALAVFCLGLLTSSALPVASADPDPEFQRYVDVWSASQGHDVCSADPWINGQFTDPIRAAGFHPFANEQLAVAGLIGNALD